MKVLVSNNQFLFVNLIFSNVIIFNKSKLNFDYFQSDIINNEAINFIIQSFNYDGPIALIVYIVIEIGLQKVYFWAFIKTFFAFIQFFFSMLLK